MKRMRTLLAVGAAAIALNAARLAAQTTTVIVVRHAEKGSTPANDPPLTDIGRERAKALWLAVKDAGVDAIVTTQLARTRETAAPSAAALHITPDVVPMSSSANHAADVAAAVKRHVGHTVLVVGHSNTVPGIIKALGAPEPATICDSAYDDLYVVTIPASGSATLIHSRYGAATPVDATCAAMR